MNIDTKKHGRKSVLTYSIIFVCIAVYIFELAYAGANGQGSIDALFRDYGFSPQSFFEGKWWTPVTSVFLHASPDHLVLNMIALFFFGRVIEESLGRKKFLAIFFLSSFVGTLAVAASAAFGFMPADVPTLGASAAIFGLLGTAMLVKPFEMVFYPYIIPVPLIMVAIIYTLFNVGALVMVLVSGAETDIAYVAHIGGLLTGAFFGFKEEGMKRSLLIILLIIVSLIAIPVFFSFLSYFETFSYANALTQVFGKV